MTTELFRNRVQIIKDNLTDTAHRFLALGPPPNTHTPSCRDTNGRFTKGCQPGPGCRRKQVRKFVPPAQLLQRGLDMDDSSKTWEIIVDRFGPAAAHKLLENVEAEYGPICFRHVALQAISAGHQKAIGQQHSPEPISQNDDSKRTPSKRPGRKKSGMSPVAAAHCQLTWRTR